MALNRTERIELSLDIQKRLEDLEEIRRFGKDGEPTKQSSKEIYLFQDGA